MSADLRKCHQTLLSLINVAASLWQSIFLLRLPTPSEAAHVNWWGHQSCAILIKAVVHLQARN
jgi:hypothetical protein